MENAGASTIKSKHRQPQVLQLSSNALHVRNRTLIKIIRNLQGGKNYT